MKSICGLLLIALICLISIDFASFTHYEPNWDSLDKRPLPEWYDDAKVGIFIHWGLFSVPAFGSEWFWWYWKGTEPRSDYIRFMDENFKPNFSYPEFAPSFTARHFDPDQWGQLFRDSGAKYVVLTSKHHEGFTLWPSSTSWNWNSMDVGPKRDLIGDLAAAVRGYNLTFGLYHSLFEWFNPLYVKDKENNFTTRYFPVAKTMPELTDLVLRYKPDVIWSDGEWDGPDSYWGSTKWIAWLYNESPVKDSVVINDRWARGTLCQHGGFLTCTDRYLPGHLMPRKWENAMTLDRNSWGYVSTSTLSDYVSFKELVDLVAKTVSLGGNILINVGPTSEGIIAPIMQERLKQLGNWLSINGEAIYKTKPWVHQNDSFAQNVYYTQPKSDPDVVFAIFMDWPANDILELGSVAGDPFFTKVYQITPDASYKTLDWAMKNEKMVIKTQLFSENLTAWVLKIERAIPLYF
ncbi:alpha-L-fucosidase isoform X1 [Brevipalpus obovatus]|uniref:alpha-L-fucosidase isoform X1 n=1 Tax=Brevipalpus obovatus TaxID=246614 RepID=UPI003D9EC672